MIKQINKNISNKFLLWVTNYLLSIRNIFLRSNFIGCTPDHFFFCTQIIFCVSLAFLHCEAHFSPSWLQMVWSYSTPGIIIINIFILFCLICNKIIIDYTKLEGKVQNLEPDHLAVHCLGREGRRMEKGKLMLAFYYFVVDYCSVLFCEVKIF